jgi:hypothetical protein
MKDKDKYLKHTANNLITSFHTIWCKANVRTLHSIIEIMNSDAICLLNNSEAQNALINERLLALFLYKTNKTSTIFEKF